MIATLALLAVVAAHLTGAWCAWRAIETSPTSQGAVGWTVALLSAPFLAVPFFLVFGQPRFRGYLTARRAAEDASDVEGRKRRTRRSEPGDGVAADRGLHSMLAFERLAQLPVVKGNEYELLVDGEAAFAAMFDAIRSAEHYVLVAFYIISDDQVGGTLKELLVARAREGVSVRVLFDEIGSQSLPSSYIDALRDAGVEIHGFHSRRHPKHPFQINFRNHRKIVVVDGEAGFVGGLNVGDEYLGRSEKYGPWRDTHLALRGPAAAQLQLVFAEDWHWATGETLDLRWDAAPRDGGVDALVIPSGPADKVPTGSLFFCNAIAAARSRVWIASPYFVPDAEVLAALKIAAMRGVQVRLLLPANRDQLVVWLAAHAYFDEVRDVGVEVHLHQVGFMHQKVVVVDDAFASVGSMNLDNRSCRLNFECVALLVDKGATEEVARMLAADFAASRRHETPLREARPLVRYGAPIARLFAPLL